MAPPRQQAQRRNQSSQVEHVYELGVRGRKTGVVLEDTGERDEFGMEPVDRLFSSPEKETVGGAYTRNQHDTDEEQDMDIDEASTLGPATVSRMRKDRPSLPRARSPAKTYLNSPARQNPHLGRTSSPIRGSIFEERTNPPKSPTRRLDLSASSRIKPATNGHSKPNGSRTQNARANGHSAESSEDDDAILQGRRTETSKARYVEENEEDEDEEPMDVLDLGGDYDDNEPLAADNEDIEPEVVEEEEEEEEEEVVKPRRRGPKPKGKIVEASVEEAEPEPAELDPEPTKKRKGRPAKNAPTEVAEPVVKSPKRRRHGQTSVNSDAADESNEADAAQEREAKRQRTEAKTATQSKASTLASKTPAAKGKPGRKRKSSGVGVDSPAVIPRPPMPKRRGLESLRREEFAVQTTRSGRVSTRPLEFWRGEHYEIDPDEEETIEDKGGRRIKIGAPIKGVVRVNYDEDEPKVKRRRGRQAGTGRPKRRASDVEEEDEYREDWEDDPGRLTGECIYWYSEYEENPPQEEDQVEVAEEDLAISEAAVQMKDIKDATFKFDKTLTLPFFGTGLVDLPPQSEKRTKNARKMHLAFFVHYGNVRVTVAQTVFRISKGGHFFVPRGNSYQIENDTDRPARLFFCQGCEVRVPAESQEL